MLRLVAIPVSTWIIANAHTAKFHLFGIECEVRSNVLCKRTHDDVVVQINACNAAVNLNFLEVDGTAVSAIVVVLRTTAHNLVALNAGPLV